ncbi:XRE family transcriptional regulator [Burkholderia aenigmatica]|uniref:XRE family transcriptional regulator n=1 Tax=Burkholderia aenigmatica TaxID=2015348 RepID=A0A6P2PNU1_9BURK|nr:MULTISPECIES: helix-turn-helix transcriptional regulator [Burkholderia]MDN7520215.1 helix-turn-helix transcriptional regulator [Burkholderia sp. AU45251]VWC09877.1 XRE family transcriptional regulator [Burkholderia aenigmatica]HDR9487857.1 helix-turn-helix transcriptional regulator [Burkholderia aenigmatica]HDR9519574.1 helix-turn-helix transcriptional regulator [Burkholderia aenigmatica]HDR9596604.1 helix-turn-helix transcriptional regulator [Burkholderia aenigmatica]
MARTLPRPIASPDPLAQDLAALGALVRNRRAQNQMRIDDAADMLGVSKDVLSRLENGRAVSLDKLFKVLDGLGLNLLVVPKRDVPVARKALHELAEPTVLAGSREGA